MDIRVVFYVEIQNIVPVPCACERQKCKGLYIPTREGQKTCLFDIVENGQLDKYPRLKDKRYTTQELLIYILKLEDTLSPEGVDLYEAMESFEEMVD